MTRDPEPRAGAATGPRTGRPRRALVGAAGAAAFLATLAGCTTTIARRPSLPAMGTHGSGWEAVLLPPATNAALAMVDRRTLPEYGRRDASLNPQPDAPMLASDEWPQQPRPSLRRYRYLTLPTRPETVIFFSPVRSDTAEPLYIPYNY